ncbi:MAG: hypothetical protein K1Y36_16360 [Blastocatellia bacterium]|nr:hypothetical protein [Blastocatellia bacterium]
MRIGILSESPADEAAVKILAEAVLEVEIEVEPVRLRDGRGVSAVLNQVEVVTRKLYYSTEACGLIFVVDSDDTSMHLPEHPLQKDDDCRLCQVRENLQEIKERLNLRYNQIPFNFAVGLAIPAVEAWYLCNTKDGMNKTETAWFNAKDKKQKPYNRKQLKHLVYGTDRPSLPFETKIAIREATRLAQDISILEQNFPNGFGSLANDLRKWIQ